MAEQKCAHAGCDCEIQAGTGVSKGDQQYCSNQCADPGSSAAEKCDCGHADCA